MKQYKHIILALAAVGAALSACDDEKMQWTGSDSSITASDLPLELAEKIANYDYLKSYVNQYHPEMYAGAGISADLYVQDADYKKVVDENFSGITMGNAMKHQSMVAQL